MILKPELHLRLRLPLPPPSSTTLVSLLRALASEQTTSSVLQSTARVNSSYVVRERDIGEETGVFDTRHP